MDSKSETQRGKLYFVTFNSIEWIRAKLEKAQERVKQLLSIPLNGF